MLVKTIELDCECFEDLAKKQGITIISSTNTHESPCVHEFQRTDGSKGWAKETTLIYAEDGYISKIEIYDEPISL